MSGKRMKIHLLYKDMEDRPLGDDLIETRMFSGKIDFAVVDIPRGVWIIEGTVKEVQDV